MAVPRYAAVSAFGFSGTNAHLVLSESPNPNREHKVEKSAYLIMLSGKTKSALTQRIEDLTGWLETRLQDKSLPPVFLEDIAYTLNTGRVHFDERCAIVADSLTQLLETLQHIKLGQQRDNYVINPEINKKRYQALFEEILSKVLDDINSAETLDAKTYKHKLQSLGELYVLKYDIDFSRLHQGETNNRISLPTYPFASEHYWIPINNKLLFSKVPSSTVSKLHPFLDSGISTSHEKSFIKLLKKETNFM